jgi:phage terminase large subunit
VELRESRKASLIDLSFKAQADFINDPSRFKAALCTRRAGKSNGMGRYLLKTAMENDGCNVAYVALTRDSAWRIMWKDVLNDLINTFKLPVLKTNETKLSIQLSNGSMIYLLGVDKDEREMEKLLGQKFKLVVVDECASYRIDLRDLVYRVIRPALSDLRGTCAMIGTPGNYAKGLFYEVTNNQDKDWSVHKWTTFDNPYMSAQWSEEIEDLKRNNPRVVETPMFKQMYLAEWYVDTARLVYRFDPKRNLAKKPIGDYYYILGVDLGYEDATAFSVIAWSLYDRKAYVVYAYKQSKMTIYDVAQFIKKLQSVYTINKMVVDASAKQSVEEMRQRYLLPLEAAEKTDKSGHIQIMNSEFIIGNIVLDPDSCNDLVDEYAQLIWDDAKTKMIEHPGCDNHLADATYYAWRYAKNYINKAKPHKKNEVEKVEDWWEKESIKLTNKGEYDEY